MKPVVPTGEQGFSPMRFLRRMQSWSILLAIGVTVVGGALTRDWRFVLACVLGAAFDIVSIAVLLGRVTLASPDDALRWSRIAAMLAGPRLAAKALLLALAAALPRILDMRGMLAGVLVFDTTVMTFGSFKAAADMWR